MKLTACALLLPALILAAVNTVGLPDVGAVVPPREVRSFIQLQRFVTVQSWFTVGLLAWLWIGGARSPVLVLVLSAATVSVLAIAFGLVEMARLPRWDLRLSLELVNGGLVGIAFHVLLIAIMVRTAANAVRDKPVT